MARKKKTIYRSGTVAVETAMVIGVVIMLIIGGFDLAVQLYVRHNMASAAREAARYLAVKNTTQEEAEASALELLSGINADFSVTTQIQEQDATVTISVPQKAVSLGLFCSEGEATITTKTTMRREDY